MANRKHDFSLSIFRWDGPEFALTYKMVADVACTVAEWEGLRATDEGEEGETAYPHVSIQLNSDTDETREEEITLSIATARVLLPDLVADLVRRRLEDPNG
jgi:hypothetical protein